MTVSSDILTFPFLTESSGHHMDSFKLKMHQKRGQPGCILDHTGELTMLLQSRPLVGWVGAHCFPFLFPSCFSAPNLVPLSWSLFLSFKSWHWHVCTVWVTPLTLAKKLMLQCFLVPVMIPVIIMAFVLTIPWEWKPNGDQVIDSYSNPSFSGCCSLKSHIITLSFHPLRMHAVSQPFSCELNKVDCKQLWCIVALWSQRGYTSK